MTITLENGVWTARWTGDPGQNYNVEFSALIDGEWFTGRDTVTGPGGRTDDNPDFETVRARIRPVGGEWSEWVERSA